MKPNTNELLMRLRQAEWFYNAGKPLPAQADVEFLKNWPDAVEVYTSQLSEDAGLEAQNALTVQLATHHREQYQLWNSKVSELKPPVVQLISSKLAQPKVAACIPSHAGKALIDAIRWDLLGLCMACEYADLVPINRYFELVEHWYLAGHFPCGWIGDVPDNMVGAFQVGKLAVL